MWCTWGVHTYMILLSRLFQRPELASTAMVRRARMGRRALWGDLGITVLLQTLLASGSQAQQERPQVPELCSIADDVDIGFGFGGPCEDRVPHGAESSMHIFYLTLADEDEDLWLVGGLVRGQIFPDCPPVSIGEAWSATAYKDEALGWPQHAPNILQLAYITFNVTCCCATYS